jgi:hypothetical protein
MPNGTHKQLLLYLSVADIFGALRLSELPSSCVFLQLICHEVQLSYFNTLVQR